MVRHVRSGAQATREGGVDDVLRRGDRVSLDRLQPRMLLGWEWAPPQPPSLSQLRYRPPRWAATSNAAIERSVTNRRRIRYAALLFVGLVGLVAMSDAGVGFGLAVVSTACLVVALGLQSSERLEGEADRLEAGREQFTAEVERWRQRVRWEEDRSRSYFDQVPRWYPIIKEDPAARTDVFGGSPSSWSALLETSIRALHGAAAITVVDLSLTGVGLGAVTRVVPEGSITHLGLPSALGSFDPILGTTNPGHVASYLTSDGTQIDSSLSQDIRERALPTHSRHRRAAGVSQAVRCRLRRPRRHLLRARIGAQCRGAGRGPLVPNCFPPRSSGSGAVGPHLCHA